MNRIIFFTDGFSLDVARSDANGPRPSKSLRAQLTRLMGDDVQSCLGRIGLGDLVAATAEGASPDDQFSTWYTARVRRDELGRPAEGGS